MKLINSINMGRPKYGQDSTSKMQSLCPCINTIQPELLRFEIENVDKTTNKRSNLIKDYAR